MLKPECRFTHHVSLSAILSRSDEDVIPGQQEQQSQRDHVELKVPHHHYEELSRWTEREKTRRERAAQCSKGHTRHFSTSAQHFVFSSHSRNYSFIFLPIERIIHISTVTDICTTLVAYVFSTSLAQHLIK